MSFDFPFIEPEIIYWEKDERGYQPDERPYPFMPVDIPKDNEGDQKKKEEEQEGQVEEGSQTGKKAGNIGKFQGFGFAVWTVKPFEDQYQDEGNNG